MIELDGALVTAWAPGAGAGAEAPGGRRRRAAAEHVVRILGPVTCTLTERRVAVVGANGSGKSTLARLLNGLTLPSVGTVRVDGLDTARDGAEVRRRVGFLFTDPDAQVVMPTPVEDVALSLRRTGVPARERDARARESLDRVGLADRADLPVRALSGGQRQLLALAAVLATEPQIVVCDEPTTLLDLRWRAAVDRILAGLPQQVVIVTHDLDAAARADRVLVVDEGRIVHDGAPAAALAAYRALMTEPAVTTGAAPVDVPHLAARATASSGTASPDPASPDPASPDPASPDLAAPDPASPDLAAPDPTSPDVAAPDPTSRP